MMKSVSLDIIFRRINELARSLSVIIKIEYRVVLMIFYYEKKIEKMYVWDYKVTSRQYCNGTESLKFIYKPTFFGNFIFRTIL